MIRVPRVPRTPEVLAPLVRVGRWLNVGGFSIVLYNRILAWLTRQRRSEELCRLKADHHAFDDSSDMFVQFRFLSHEITNLRVKFLLSARHVKSFAIGLLKFHAVSYF